MKAPRFHVLRQGGYFRLCSAPGGVLFACGVNVHVVALVAQTAYSAAPRDL